MKSAIAAALAASSMFIAGNAIAADATIYDPAPAPVAAAAYDWTGLYLGVHAGITTGDFDYDAGPVGGPALLGVSVSGSGFVAGAQIGYDWQSGPWVFGALADIAFSNHEASLSASLAGLGSVEAESQLNYLGTVRGRVGYAFDRALFYAHGGFAYGETEQTIEVSGVEVYNDSTGRTGWTIGAGLEYALTDRISFGTEYSYVDLGDEEIFSDPAVAFVDEDVSFHTIKAVINFRF